MSYDFTGFTVSGSHITNTNATTVTVAGLTRNEASYDYLAGSYPQGSYIQGSFSVSGGSGAGTGSVGIGYADGLGTGGGTGATTNEVSLLLTYGGGGYQAFSAKRESSVGASVAMNVLTASTTYYYREGVLSCIGGQYGGHLSQTFSDSAYTTQLAASGVALAANVTYTDLYAAQSINTGDATVISAAIGAITGFTETVGEDLNAMSGSDATIATYAGNTNIIVFTAFPGNSTTGKKWVSKGAGYFAGNISAQAVLNLTAYSAAANNQAVTLGFSNTNGDYNAANHSLAVEMDTVAGSAFRLYIAEINGASRARSASYLSGTFNNPPFHKIRVDRAVGTYGTAYLGFYDPAFGTLIGSEVSLALRENVAYQYEIPLSSFGTGGSAQTITGTLGGYRATSPASATQFAGDAASVASATGALTTAITLAGSASATSTATCSLTTAILLSGNAQAVATAAGALFDLSALRGDATASATASGNLTTAILLVGSASTVATATGLLTSLPHAAVTEEFTARFKNLVTGAGITGAGASISVAIRQEITGYFYDFNTGTAGFKSSGWTTPTDTMTESNATLAAGLYGYLLDVSTFPDGDFTMLIDYAGSPLQDRAIPFRVVNGYLVKTSLPIETRAEIDANSIKLDIKTSEVAAAVVAAKNANIVDGTITDEVLMKAILAFIAGKRSGLGTATEQYMKQDGVNPRLSFTPTDANGNGTVTIDGT